MSDGEASARPNSTRAVVLIPFILTTLIWGSTWIVIRDQLAVVPPSWSVTYRFTLGGLVMLGWALWRGDRLRLDARGLGFAAMLGVLQFCLNFNLVYRAEGHVTSGLVAVVFALLLVPNAVLARLFLGQKMGRQLLVGSAVAIAGVALLFLHEARADAHAARETLIGIGFTLAAVFCASIANVMQATKTARDYPMTSIIGIAMLSASLCNAAVAWASAGPPVIEWRIGYLVGLAYLGIVASALAFSLYFGLIRMIGPAKAAYTSILIPVIAMLLSTVFEHYRWSWLSVAGGVLALFGLVLALRARRPNR